MERGATEEQGVHGADGARFGLKVCGGMRYGLRQVGKRMEKKGAFQKMEDSYQIMKHGRTLLL